MILTIFLLVAVILFISLSVAVILFVSLTLLEANTLAYVVVIKIAVAIGIAHATVMIVFVTVIIARVMIIVHASPKVVIARRTSNLMNLVGPMVEHFSNSPVRMINDSRDRIDCIK